MKILQITNLFSPVHGGAAEVPYQLSKQLAKRGHQVIIYASDSKLEQKYVAPGVTIHAFNTWVGLAGFNITPGIIGKAKGEIEHLDVVHMHNYRTFENIVTHHYAEKSGTPYILQAHGSLMTFFQKGRLKKIFDAIWGYELLADASRVIAVTKMEAEQYKSMGIREDKIETIPNAIDLSQFENLPSAGEFKKKHGLSKERIILFLGRLAKVKGIDLLLRASARLLTEVKDVRLVVVGPDGGCLAELKSLARELRIEDKILFLGALYGVEKLEAYVDAEVYVLPSVYEIFGLTILEALACGTPVIVTDQCGIADKINGRAGIVIPRDEACLQDALRRLLNDYEARQQFVVGGKKLIQEEFTWSRVAEKMESVYHSIVGAK